jgi:bifunctional DNA-binding transcriptional regulator/antitoxin component of YhaV-PrlF toxin-antitoxin module
MVYLPSDVTSSLGLKEGDELDFFKMGDKQYLIAKKSDVLQMLTGGTTREPIPIPQVQSKPSDRTLQVSDEELRVLKKLDTIKYNDRTAEKLKQVLNDNERKVLRGLIAKEFVTPFKRVGEQKSKYGITKSVYDQFLFGKRQQQQPVPQAPVAEAQEQKPKAWEKKVVSASGGYLNMLETAGFLVVANQAEASAVSAELEESIRRGLVIGTRAFNKKYYIALKSFVARSAPGILKAMGDKAMRIEEISKDTGIDEDGIRAVLYMLAEQGEVTETKRDIFKAVS